MSEVHPMTDGKNWAVPPEPAHGEDDPTRLRNHEAWDLKTALPALIADALRRLARGISYPVGMTKEAWEAELERVAGLFDVATVHDGWDTSASPREALEWLATHWDDLWD